MKSEKEKLMKVIEGVKSISTSLQLIIIVPLRFKPEIENLKKVANDCGCDIDVIGIPENPRMTTKLSTLFQFRMTRLRLFMKLNEGVNHERRKHWCIKRR